MTRKEQLLNDISIVEFILMDLALFLDTHPKDTKAIDHFNHYVKIRNQMVREFSQKFYPLTMDQAESNMEWRWGNAPLPWEGV